MPVRARVAVLLLAVAAVLAWAPVGSAVMPIQGTWVLDWKNSKNPSDQMKGIDLQITLKGGHELVTQRMFEGTAVGDPLAIVLDGVAREREIAKGQRGTVQASWKSEGKLIEQIIKTKAANLFEAVQTTLITVTDDGEVMTRVQTTKQAGDVTERVLIYRKKH